jgi:trimeric autotransporter adhesin
MKKIIILILLLFTTLANSQQIATPPQGTIPVMSNQDFSNKKGIYNSFFVNTFFGKVTTAEMNVIATPLQGRNVYNTTTNTNWYYNGTAWVNSFQAPYINSVSLPLSVANQNLSIATANATTNGIINFNDWNVFNNKQPLIVAGTTAQYWRGDKTWQTLDKTVVGLANVDDTTDLNKPISTAAQTALNLKQNAISVTAPITLTGTSIGITTSTTTTNGQLLAPDFVSFNNKLATANNGLTATGTLVELGGTLTKNTNIAGNFNLTTSGTGNVGIGTTTPTVKLDVVGSVKISGTTSPAISFDNRAIMVAKNASGVYEHFFYPRWSDNSTILNYGVAGFNIRTNDSRTVLFMGDSGNIGVGVATPSANLDISGQVRIRGGLPALGKVLTSDALGLASWQNAASSNNGLTKTGDLTELGGTLTKNTNIAGNFNLTTSGTGNIGIGTTTPTAKLDVVGNIRGTRFVGYGNVGNSTNSAVGESSLASITTGTSNSANGNGSLQNTTAGVSNTAIGDRALFRNTTGNENTATGSFSMINNTTGVRNTATGMNALQANTTANNNVANGFNALLSNTIGTANTAMGAETMTSNISGNQNTAVGSRALFSNTTGSGNIAIGEGTLLSETTGIRNISIGFQAGRDVVTGSSNTIIGESLFGTANLSNTVIIGAGGSTRIFIDNLGNMGIGTTTPTVKLEVAGTIKATGIVNYTSTAVAIADATLLTGTFYTVTVAGVKQLFVK